MTTKPLFHEIVERHGATVLRVCAAVLGPGADAEDAWSETFLAVLVSPPDDGVTNLEAWLVRIARNKSIDVLRARARSTPVDDVSPFSTSPEGSESPALEWDDELWGHVAALTERQQTVIAHRFIAQWTYPEIAEKLGGSPAAARRCGADAVSALRARLSVREGDSNE